MPIIDFLSRLAATVLRLALWTLAVLVGLVLISLAVVALLVWTLLNLLRGRKPPLAVFGQFRDLQRFRDTFGQAGFKTGRVWPQPEPEAPSPETSAGVNPESGALARRIAKPEAVVDVQARDLPSDHRAS